jgi:hypothetical protein
MAQTFWILPLFVMVFLEQGLLPVAAFGDPPEKTAYNLQLGDYHHAYTYIFSGQVTCNDKPCSAHLRLQFRELEGTDIIEAASAGKDGNYSLSVVLKEVPQEPAEWKLMAEAPDGRGPSIQLEGRAIAVDDNCTVIANAIHLGQGMMLSMGNMPQE